MTMSHRLRICGAACAFAALFGVTCVKAQSSDESPAPIGWRPPGFLSDASAAQAPAIRPKAPATPSTYKPITSGERIDWVWDGTVGLSSLRIGIIAASWDTAINTPEEWGRGFSGFGKRYAEREADVAISSTIEAGLGAIWGEDPRYIPSQRHGLWPRVRYAVKTVFLAPRHDDRLQPAWGRLAGNVVNNIIENSWLPPSVTTGRQTTLRSAQGYGGRLIGNLWGEFWPDLQKRLPGARGKS